MPSASWLNKLFLKFAALAAIVTTIVVTAIGTYLTGFLPPPSDVKCWVSNMFSSQEQPKSRKFTVLVSPLDRDHDGRQTNHVVSSFNLLQPHISVVSICDPVRIAAGDRESETEKAHEAASKLLKERNGDILLWGHVDTADEMLTLYVTGDAKFIRNDYVNAEYALEGTRLPQDFHNAFAVRLVTEAIAQAEKMGQRGSVAESLDHLADKIEMLLTEEATESTTKQTVPKEQQRPPVVLAADQKLDLQIARGQAKTIIGGRGDNEILEEAVKVLHDALREIENGPDKEIEKRSDKWRETQVHYAYALVRLGDRQRDRKLLEEAATLSEEALDYIDWHVSPELWAETQQNRGRALLHVGQLDVGTEELRRAAGNLRAAANTANRLKNRPDEAERWSLEEGESLTFRGSALTRLGERTGDEKLLRQAVASLEKAVELRRQVPLGRATAESLLGVARARLAERLGEMGRDGAETEIETLFNDAVQDLKAALNTSLEHSKVLASRDQTHLALVLILCGENPRSSRCSADLEFAETLPRETLEINMLSVAEGHLKKALEIRTIDFSPVRRAESQIYLARALTNWSELVGADERQQKLKEAEAMLEEARKASWEKAPLLWAEATIELARTECALGETTKAPELFEEASRKLEGIKASWLTSRIVQCPSDSLINGG